MPRWWVMSSQLKVVRAACVLSAAIFLLTLPLAAQVEIADDWKLNLSGNLGFNYNGATTQGVSSHGDGISGDATLIGSFYNPNFLNFTIRPYYDRNQSNSLFGNVTHSSGVNSTLNLFSGSHFPGFVSYSKGFDNSGQYGLPGSDLGLATHGDTQQIGIGWSEMVADWPSLNAIYTIGSDSSSIFGSQEQTDQHYRTLNLTSGYKVDGFRIFAGYTHGNHDTNFSEVLDGVSTPIESQVANNSYQLSAQHSFPMQGAFSVSWNRSSYDYAYRDSTNTSSSGASQAVTGTIGFNPTHKLSVNSNVTFTDSLLGSLPEVVVTGGGSQIDYVSLGSFRSLSMSTDAYYRAAKSIGVRGRITHQQEYFLGQDYSSTQYGGTVDYNTNHKLPGSFTFSISAWDSADKQGNQGLGMVGNLNWSKRFDGWEINGNFSYSQNVETLVSVYTTSSMNYVGSARKQLGVRTYFSGGYGGSHSGISHQSDYMNRSDRVWSAITYGRFALNGYYSKSHGTALFTANELAPLPTGVPPSALAPSSLVIFDTKGYGFSVSATPLRRLNLSAGYGKSNGSTVDPLNSVFTKNNIVNVVANYRLRKLGFNAGYSHLNQAVGAPGGLPTTVTTYYAGIYRWFNFF